MVAHGIFYFAQRVFGRKRKNRAQGTPLVGKKMCGGGFVILNSHQQLSNGGRNFFLRSSNFFFCSFYLLPADHGGRAFKQSIKYCLGENSSLLPHC